MAFTETQKVSIAQILGTTPTLFEAHLATVTLTAEIQTAVETELSRWETSGGSFTKIHPRERNYGVETFPEAVRNDIRANIARLLEWPYSSFTSIGMGTLQIG